MPANAAFTNLAGLFDQVPATQDIFLDSYHFADRGSLLIAQAIAETIP